MNRLRKLPPLPSRPVDGHKGTFGRVLVVGGHDEMIGAPVLAGTAALRMGAGLVQIAVPMSVLPAAISITPELIGLGLQGSASNRRLLAAAQAADALVIGPGLGKSPQSRTRLMQLIRLPMPMVVDADALNMLAAGRSWPRDFAGHAVLTPHPGEMKRLAKLIGRTDVPGDEAGRIDIAAAAARRFGQVVVLKGYRTVVTDATRVYVNHTGNSSLAKAGTGDVLSGIIGALLAQKMPPFDAACLGVYLHGRAGEIAGEEIGPRSVLAGEVADMLAVAIEEMGNRR